MWRSRCRVSVLLLVRYMFKFDKDHLPLDIPYPDAKKRNLSSDRWDALPKRGPKFQMVKHGACVVPCSLELVGLLH